ncbi:vacuolar protein sorting-associated protein [Achlya hypogyna]|uniref:Vacuolar protein sorting-associated protein n=1 Tax=Achlya hypogyna TaxID=1202772 RepID=A0A1V9YDM9_ACHHY|nr:vacuolar protein sorting-associated protein [Achlya hypogyna]
MSTSHHDIWHVDYNRKRLEQAAQGWYSIGLVFGVNSVGFAIAFALFLVSRSSRSSLYWTGHTDTTATTYWAHFSRSDTVFQRFKAFYSKFRDMQSLHLMVGDEAAFYLTFQVYALRLVLAMTAFAAVVLVPVYIYAAETPLRAFSTLTIRSVPDRSPLLWVPVCSTYVFSIMYGIFLTRLGRLCNNRDPAKTNLLCMVPSSLSAKSVLVTSGVPKTMPHDRIQYLLNQIFPNYVDHVTVVYDLGPYRRLHRARVAAEGRFDRLCELQRLRDANAEPIMLRVLPGSLRFPEPWCCQRPLPDEIDAVQEKIVDSQLWEARALESIVANNEGTGRIFLVFNDAKWKARFVRKTKYRSVPHLIARAPKKYHGTLRSKIEELQLTRWTLEAAPEPDDIDWECMSYQSAKRTLLTTMIYTFLTVFIVLFTSPLAVTSAISTGAYSTTAKWVNDIVDDVQDMVAGLSPVVAKMMFSYIPTMILVMINGVLLNVVYHAGRMQPMSTDSAKEKSILHYSAVYLIFNTLFVPSFTFVSINALFQYFMDKGQVLDIFEMLFLNNSGVFFVNYVIQRAFVGTAVVMLRISEGAEFAWRWSRAVTRSEQDFAVSAWKFYTGTQSALQISVLVVIVAFSTVVPVILPFGAFYFFMQHLVDKYSLLYVRPRIKGKGTIAKTSTHASMFPLLIYQCAMSGFFLVRGTMYQNVSVTVLLMFTFILLLWHYIRDKELLQRAVGKAFAPDQTHLLSPKSSSVDLYRDPALRPTVPTNTYYGAVAL